MRNHLAPTCGWRRWLATVSLLTFAVIGWGDEPHWSTSVESALGRSGTNRAELVKALVTVPEPQRDGMAFLIENMPQRDLDSLSAGFLLTNTALAYAAWQQAPWAPKVSSEMFLNYILPYANVSEARDDWRLSFRELVTPMVEGCRTPTEAAQALNQKLFKQIKVHYSMKRRAPDQGPFESMERGVATCTGLSIILVDACRAIGVPARVVGTPLWVNKTGNHTWVEIWDGDWHFLGAAEYDAKGVDRGWFVKNASQAIKGDVKHAIYASSFKQTGLSFPLDWAPDITYVNAINVTDRYASPDQAAADVSRMTLRVNVLDRPVGERVEAKVTVTDAADPAVRLEGKSKMEPADVNDHVEFKLARQRTYMVEAERGGLKNRRFYSPGTNDQDLLVVHLAGVPTVSVPVTAQCAAPAIVRELAAKQVDRLKSETSAFFAAAPDRQADWKFASALDKLLGENETAVREIVWDAFRAAPTHANLKQDFAGNKVRSGERVSPYTVKTVGQRPATGWALFIAMHGGGGAPQELNDSQWRHMQIYYRDHPEAGGYRYVALRAPNNEWNGFYTGYVYPLIANLIEQFQLFGDVDPDKVFLMGYSHGGYGAFAIGPKMPDRFAAVHASAAALADGAEARTLRNLPFSCMVGEKDTAYGRIERCRRFAKEIADLRGKRTDIYPVTVTEIANHPHSGLPDREKIAEMYPAVRNPVPRELTWRMTDDVIRDFYWLQVSNPVKGRDFDATCENNRVKISANGLANGAILLDSRLVDFKRPVIVDFNGKATTHKPKPSLLTLCETMQRRGDPNLAFTVRLDLGRSSESAAK